MFGICCDLCTRHGCKRARDYNRLHICRRLKKRHGAPRIHIILSIVHPDEHGDVEFGYFLRVCHQLALVVVFGLGPIPESGGLEAGGVCSIAQRFEGSSIDT